MLKFYVNYNPIAKTSTIVNVLEERVEYESVDPTEYPEDEYPEN